MTDDLQIKIFRPSATKSGRPHGVTSAPPPRDPQLAQEGTPNLGVSLWGGGVGITLACDGDHVMAGGARPLRGQSEYLFLSV